MVVTIQCRSRSKEGWVIGWSVQGGLHNTPVVKEFSFEESAELVVALVLRESEFFVGLLMY